MFLQKVNIFLKMLRFLKFQKILKISWIFEIAEGHVWDSFDAQKGSLATFFGVLESWEYVASENVTWFATTSENATWFVTTKFQNFPEILRFSMKIWFSNVLAQDFPVL